MKKYILKPTNGSKVFVGPIMGHAEAKLAKHRLEIHQSKVRTAPNITWTVGACE